jgi:hypothetical protein
MISMRKAPHVVAAFVFGTLSLQAGLVGSFLPTELEVTVPNSGSVISFFAGSDASYNSVINLIQPAGFAGNPFFFNHGTAEGTALNLGSYTAGTILRFRLDVLGLNQSFFTGPAAGNPDNQIHVAHGLWNADAVIPVNGLLVGFEDLMGGGDMDFNDNMFVLANASGRVTPIPRMQYRNLPISL